MNSFVASFTVHSSRKYLLTPSSLFSRIQLPIRDTRPSKMYSVNGGIDNYINSDNQVRDGKNRELWVKRVRVSIPTSAGRTRGTDI